MIVLLTIRYDDHSPVNCGSYDDDDFKANDMCCACGGGGRARAQYSAEPEIDDICPDSVASTEESCLKAFPEELTKFCEDTAEDATDAYGDGCEWSRRGVRNILTQNFGNLIVLLTIRYDDHSPDYCGDYDDDDFTANDMCCACAVCEDTAGDATDSYGDGCEWSLRGV